MGLFEYIILTNQSHFREDTHKKNVFFSGRTTTGVGRGNPPPTTKQKTTFFYKWRKFTENNIAKKNRFFSPKIGEFFLSIAVSGYYKTKKANGVGRVKP